MNAAPGPNHPTSWTAGFSELASSLTWPRLLESARLALRPARLGLSLLILVLVGLIGQLPRLWLKGDDHQAWGGPLGLAAQRGSDDLSSIATGVLHLDHVQVGRGLADLFVLMPKEVVIQFPWSTLAILLPSLLIWSVGGGAISRMAATEFSTGRPIGWTRGLAFALSKAWSLFFSIAAPILAVGVIVGIMALVGWVMLAIPYLQVLGAVLFCLALFAGAAAVIIFVAYLIGQPMLVPAVACEGTDAIDAIQRSYAYVTGRPFRLVLYWAVLIVQVAVVTIVLAILARWIVGLTTWSTSLLLGESFQTVLRDQAAGTVPNTRDLSGSRTATLAIVGFWIQVPMLLVASYVVSYWFSGGTALYLLMRQICDGQDAGELWTPGMVAGTHAPADPEDAPPPGDEDE